MTAQEEESAQTGTPESGWTDRIEAESQGLDWKMSARISLTPAASICRRHRRSRLQIIVILLVVGITIQTIRVHFSSAPLTLFAFNDTTPLFDFWTNDNSKEPRPQSKGPPPPPLAQQNFRLQQENNLTEPPPPFQWIAPEDNFGKDEIQNEGAGKLPNDGLLERENQSLQKNCPPKSHIVFLKTHKTASSTVLNILYRYGESRGLTFALPRYKNQLSYPHYFDVNFVKGVQNTQPVNFDILCNHMRFRRLEVRKLMPEDSFYFSIVRNPVDMMESMYIYYKGLPVFSKTKSLDDFLDNGLNNMTLLNNYAHNNLAFDFGYDNTPTANTSDLETIVNKVITGIGLNFHLILISEYFDESMILLKHALCWSLEDVVSFKLNSRADKSRKSVSPTTAEKIKRWNVLDWKIYEHFNATFWRKVREVVGEGEMKREVFQLRELQAKLTSTCLEGGGAVDPRQIKDQALKPFQSGDALIQGYLLNPNLDIQTKTKCERLVIPELQYTQLLDEKQFPGEKKLT